MIIIGSKLDQRKLRQSHLALAVPQSACVSNLAVLFDPLLCFNQHVRSITKIVAGPLLWNSLPPVMS